MKKKSLDNPILQKTVNNNTNSIKGGHGGHRRGDEEILGQSIRFNSDLQIISREFKALKGSFQIYKHTFLKNDVEGKRNKF